jgi:hypothetical protein
MVNLLYIIAGILTLIFFSFFLHPFLKNKWIYYTSYRKVKKMAKKHDGETGDLLNKLADSLKQANKEEKL